MYVSIYQAGKMPKAYKNHQLRDDKANFPVEPAMVRKLVRPGVSAGLKLTAGSQKWVIWDDLG